MRSQNHKPISRGLAVSLPITGAAWCDLHYDPISGLCEDIKWVFSVSACGQESARNRCFQESGLVTIQENKVFWLKVMQCQSNTGRRNNSKKCNGAIKKRLGATRCQFTMPPNISYCNSFWKICIYLAILYLWKRQWQLSPVLLPGKSHGRRNLVGCSPRGR